MWTHTYTSFLISHNNASCHMKSWRLCIVFMLFCGKKYTVRNRSVGYGFLKVTVVFVLLRLLLDNIILGGIDMKKTKNMKRILSVVLAFALVMGSFYHLE